LFYETIKKRKRLSILQNIQSFDSIDKLQNLSKNTFNFNKNNSENYRTNDANSIGLPCMRYKNNFMLIDWLSDLPDDFPSSWFSLSRPHGSRQLLIVKEKITSYGKVSVKNNPRFHSCLPGGSYISTQNSWSGLNPSYNLCVLDCTICHSTAIFYATDVLTWKGCDLTQTTVEARLFFLSLKLSDNQELSILRKLKILNNYLLRYKIMDKNSSISPSPLIIFAPYYPAINLGLKESYIRQVPLVRDGIIFLHKYFQYLLEGGNQSAITWKDAVCSKFLINTEARNRINVVQKAFMVNHKNYLFKTEENYTITLTYMDKIKKYGLTQIQNQKLLSFNVLEIGIRTIQEAKMCLNLRLSGLSQSRKRSYADSISKIIFQYKARKNPNTFN